MIPKIIHYCWLSNDPVPESFKSYMERWHEILPDYEFKHWNFDIFDKDKSLWVKQAFENKKYAFAADYIRLYALYNYGGIYLDMDVEVLKSFDDLLKYKSFVCYEHGSDVLEVASFGVEKGSEWIKDCLSYYENRSFVSFDKNGSVNYDVKVLPKVIRDCLKAKGYLLKPIKRIEDLELCSEKVIPVLTCDYFSPKSYQDGKIYASDNTYSIHHFAGSWQSKNDILKRKICLFLGPKIVDYLVKIKHCIKR